MRFLSFSQFLLVGLFRSTTRILVFLGDICLRFGKYCFKTSYKYLVAVILFVMRTRSDFVEKNLEFIPSYTSSIRVVVYISYFQKQYNMFNIS